MTSPEPLHLPALRGRKFAVQPVQDLGALDGLRREFGARIESELATAVLRARLNGATWTEIGAALQVSKQAARARWLFLDEGAGPVELQVSRVDGTPRFYSHDLDEYLDPAGKGHQRALSHLYAVAAA